MSTIDEATLTDALHEILDSGEHDALLTVEHICTFREAGILTSNEGLVVRIGSAEFQIQVVRSR